MQLHDFDFFLPDELIAQHPPEKRGSSRMLVLSRSSGDCEIRKFKDLPAFLNKGDCAVINNTKVIGARVLSWKNGDGGKVEVFLLRKVSDCEWTCFLRPGKRVRAETKLLVRTMDGGDGVWLVVKQRNNNGTFIVESKNTSFDEIIEKYGHVPLPPYIKRGDTGSDKERYQTIFASEAGAVAAPTAGLHFTDEIFAEFTGRGVLTAELTLHVGPGTFLPVSSETIEEHRMHSEYFSLSSEASQVINEAKGGGGRVLAVGTTTVRVLETCALPDGTVKPLEGETDIFIYPPYKPKTADMLLTNFHLPKSTLLMLVATFADLKHVLKAYELAKKEGFKFYSYGDCMLLIP